MGARRLAKSTQLGPSRPLAESSSVLIAQAAGCPHSTAQADQMMKWAPGPGRGPQAGAPLLESSTKKVNGDLRWAVGAACSRKP